MAARMMLAHVAVALTIVIAARWTDAQGQIRAVVYVSGVSVPVAFVQDPTDARVQFVVEQHGVVRVIHDGVLVGTPFLDVAAAVSYPGERGLLGLAFPPDAATSGRCFVNFTNPDGHTVIARFTRSADPLVADPASRTDLRWSATQVPLIEQPYSNHNGGTLAFGPDGFLYIGMGDGGSANDPSHRAQDAASRLGKFLRIDVSVPDAHPTGFVVPPDNPFLSSGPAGTLPEIWSFGHRNPWKFSFDDPALGGTGALVIGDVGQGAYEEINYEPAGRGGRNYGWRNREGAHAHIADPPPAFLPLTDPVHEYGHADGRAVMGGYIYRGRMLGPAFRGRYFFADYSTRRVWSVAFTIDGDGEAQASGLAEHTSDLGGVGAVGNVSSFGVDAAGELYILNHAAGQVLRVIAPLSAPANVRIPP